MGNKQSYPFVKNVTSGFNVR